MSPPLAAMTHLVYCLLVGLLFNASDARIHKGHAYLDVYIKLTPEHQMCPAYEKCTIPYALSMLNSPNQFDLQSTMMQEGVLNHSNGRFNDSTVMRLSRQIKHHEGKLYLGLRLFDIPEGSQDYTIIDVTRVIDSGEKTKLEMITDAFGLSMKVRKEHEVTKEHYLSATRAMRQKPSFNCGCKKKQCSCCAFMTIQKIHLDDNVCVNITYLPDDIGIEMTVSIDRLVVYSAHLSVRNPPPACFEVPHLREYASLCVKLTDVEVGKKHFTGCVELEAELYHVRIAQANLGCFDLPLVK